MRGRKPCNGMSPDGRHLRTAVRTIRIRASSPMVTMPSTHAGELVDGGGWHGVDRTFAWRCACPPPEAPACRPTAFNAGGGHRGRTRWARRVGWCIADYPFLFSCGLRPESPAVATSWV